MCWNKQLLFAVLLSLYASTGFCQNPKIDSLQLLLLQTDGARKVEVLHSLIFNLWINYPDSAEKYVREAIYLSDNLKDSRLLAISYRLLGGVHNYHGMYDSAIVYARKAYDLSIKINDSTLIAVCLNNIGWGYYQLGSYAEALENLLKSLSMPIHERRQLTISNIGYVYTKLNDYETARKYFQQSWETAGGNKNTKVDVLYGVGQTYLLENNYSEAGKNFRQSLILAQAINNKSWCARAHSGLAKVFYHTNSIDSARVNFKKSLHLYSVLGDRSGISEVYYHISKMFTNMILFDSAFHFINASHKIAMEIKARDRLLENYEQYETLYLQRGRYDSALYFQSLYVELYEKKLAENSAINISDVQVRIQEAENIRQLAYKDNQLEGKTRQTQLSFGLAILALAFSLIVYRYYSMKKKLRENLAMKHQEISSQKDEIARKNVELNNLSEEKNNLIGIVAHDLKSPLNQIRGLISVIKMSPAFATAKAAEPIQLIENSATRLTEMIGKILDVEAIESKQLNLKAETIDFSELVKAIIERGTNDAQQKQIHIHTSIEDNVWIEVDRSYADQVIENLLSNAIKFSPPGKNIYIKTLSKDGTGICEIRDEGPGFTKEDKKKLFRKYQRLSANPTGNESTTGLGLSIVKKFVEAMKGEIWCESEEGKGSSFFVRFDCIKK